MEDQDTPAAGPVGLELSGPVELELEGSTADGVLDAILASVPAPR